MVQTEGRGGGGGGGARVPRPGARVCTTGSAVGFHRRTMNYSGKGQNHL